MWHFDSEVRKEGHELIAGIDEAGRGPLAGPVVAASVVLPANCEIDGLDDSKKLSEKKRKKIFQVIQQKAVATGIGIVDEKVIDEINILQATKTAMADAVSRLSHKPDFLLIDGNQGIPSAMPQRTVIKGDSLSASIAAASIIAKVTRDEIMKNYHNIYPQYGFDQHKGYGTGDHLKNITRYGPCEIHRKTFKGVKEYCGN